MKIICYLLHLKKTVDGPLYSQTEVSFCINIPTLKVLLDLYLTNSYKIHDFGKQILRDCGCCSATKDFADFEIAILKRIKQKVSDQKSTPYDKERAEEKGNYKLWKRKCGADLRRAEQQLKRLQPDNKARNNWKKIWEREIKK